MSMSDGVYEVKKDEDTSIFTAGVSRCMSMEKIDELKDDGMTIRLTILLIIHNPYGTGSLSYYVYYTSDEDSVLSY